MIARTLDPALLNAVANRPEVRALLSGSGPIDVGPAVADMRNFALVTDLGGFVVVLHEPGVYECHTIFPLGSAAHAAAATREAMRWLFTRTDCVEIQTKVAKSNRATGIFARQMGFDRLFDRDQAWLEADGSMADGSYFSVGLQKWVQIDDLAEEVGARFHDQLEAAKAAAGSALPAHPSDPAHDKAVGAAAMMIAAGNAQKGVWTYNRWARQAGYQTIDIVSLNPLVADVRDALVAWSDGAMEVLQCRLEH